MPLTPSQLGQQIIERCRNLGFAEAGVCSAEPIAQDRADAYRAWIAAGKHGEMHYLAQNLDKRLDPGALMPAGGARSVIMVADQYHARAITTRIKQRAPSVSEWDELGTAQEDTHSLTLGARGAPAESNTTGRIARYAHGDDYHDVIKTRLHALCDQLRTEHPTHDFRAFVDTAPVHERELAVRAGLGWIGKNTLLINPRKGSWLFLGGVLTTLELAHPSPPLAGGEPDHCGTCTRCIDACPTKAITPYSVDATRCISYLTIERRSETPPPKELAAGFGEWLYGCDICQEVCPHNSPRPEGMEVGEMNPAYTPRRTSFDLLEVLGWTEEDRRRALKGSAMKRAKLEMWKRNARTLRRDLPT
ncbi:MAG: tRNA epoxyqueuosine(34) reductase QueG [Phycisphaerales bacterium]